jgi:hypothetical protein
MGVDGRRFDRCPDAKIVGPGGACNDGANAAAILSRIPTRSEPVILKAPLTTI